jgi:hypothetical protein
MSRDTAHIIGATGSPLVVTLSPVAASNAYWVAPTPAGTVAPALSGTTVAIPSLPHGDSTVHLDVPVPPGGSEIRFVSGAAYVLLNTLDPANPHFNLQLFGE